MAIFKSEDALKSITDGLAWLAASCWLRGLLHLFDNNVLSHRFLCRLLNTLYGLKLELMDRIQANYPAIDLGDTENRTAYQITTEKAGTKVQHTLNKFVEHGLQAKYDKLKVLVIGERQKEYTALTIPTGIAFNSDTDIIDLTNLLKDIEALSTPSLEKLALIFDEELNPVRRQSAPLVGVTLTGEYAATPDEAASVVVKPPIAVNFETQMESYKSDRKLRRSSPDELRRVFQLVGKEGREGVAAAEFNRELDAHLKEYRDWLECMALLHRIKAHTIYLEVWSVNRSEFLADDVAVSLTFPSECALVLVNTDDDPSRILPPPPPGPPKRPSSLLSDFVHAGVSVNRTTTSLPDLTTLAEAIRVSRRKGPTEIKFAVDRLRPGEPRRVMRIAVLMDPASVVPIDIRYTVVGANIPKPSTGIIRVDIQQAPSSPSSQQV